ncbi:30S ribosomal protein S4 [Thermodesulfovibrionales bacterium]|nr:30S ribosomal protein S4 [Thermodesulfovibrionales bacterium]MCL0049791.1 30S ribosomal protein S4 [Thermodesulfovibrionales bacterium]
MARYAGALCRLCRREGEKLFLKGIRCYTEKCAIERRKYAPGQHGQRRGKPSDYGIQLREKQKIKRIYGILEKQFRIYFEKASRMKGITGEVLLQMLERRLDNTVYRMGFSASRSGARQLVRHGHFFVNEKRVDIPSYILRPGDIVRVRESSKDIQAISGSLAAAEHKELPVWIEVDMQSLTGKLIRVPSREEIQLPVQEQLVVEFYSR